MQYNTHLSPTFNSQVQFLLNFIFSIILLFSLNVPTSLKSACTGDIDLNGGNIINVDEILYTSKEIVINNIRYASPYVNARVFAGVADLNECPSTNTTVGDVYLKESRNTANICPVDTTFVTISQLDQITPAQVVAVLGRVASSDNQATTNNPQGCRTSHIFATASDATRIQHGTATATVWGDNTLAGYYGIVLCRYDTQ